MKVKTPGINRGFFLRITGERAKARRGNRAKPAVGVLPSRVRTTWAVQLVRTFVHRM